LAAVHQQVGEAAGQHVGFFFGFVKVGVPVHGVLLDVGEHLAGDLGHTGFGITVGSRGGAVHGTEVALAIHQGIPQAEILGLTDHGVVDGSVAVGLVGGQHGTYGVGGFAVGMLGVGAALVRGVQDAPVHGLEAFAHSGQRAGNNDRHGIVQEGRFDLLFDIAL